MKNLNIVLVKSKYPRNVGLISRVMSNFSIQRLILVAPRCELDLEARQGAAQGQAALSSATLYNDWNEFYEYEPDGLRIAFSRRQGRRRASLTLDETLSLDVVNLEKPTYMIFGAEDHGLSSEDLEHVHRLTHYDLPGELQSMNLSHAVLVAIQAFYNKFGQNNKPTSTEASQYKDPEPSLKLWLETLQFDLKSQTKWNALTMLKQLIMRASPTSEEIHKLEMIIQQTVRRINEKSKPH